VTTKNHYRVIDANLNRLREGIRVVEDIYRYILDDKDIASRLKNIRHLARGSNYNQLLEHRDIINDCLKSTTDSEKTRNNIKDILISNFKRAQESARTLEEFDKLSDKNQGLYKNIRYELYDLEKSILNIKI
jgi:thiamine-phosphate pyrophosphorylase